jgi:hypothetical protein
MSGGNHKGSRIARSEVVRLIVITWLFTAAPVAGDIGSCGQAADDLDAAKFFQAKADVDCQQCSGCGFATNTCVRACSAPPERAFEVDCYPLVHDGEVCLDALRAASCDEYRAYVDDQAPEAPTECNFCPPDERP